MSVGLTPGINVFKGARHSIGGPVPDAAPESCQVQHTFVMGIYDWPVTPLEIVALQSLPVLSIIIRTIGPTVESVDKKRGWMIWVNGDAINVRSLIKDTAPAFATIIGNIKSSEALLTFNSPGPTCQVHTSGVSRIKDQVIRRIRFSGKRYLLPVFLAVCRFVESAVNLFAIF